MIVTNWNYICGLTTLVITFSLSINLYIMKLIMYLSRKINNKEGYFYNRGELEDGFFSKNKGNISEIEYYKKYSFILIAIPSLTFLFLLVFIKELTC